jgi:hypothetical protein
MSHLHLGQSILYDPKAVNAASLVALREIQSPFAFNHVLNPLSQQVIWIQWQSFPPRDPDDVIHGRSIKMIPFVLSILSLAFLAASHVHPVAELPAP